MSNPNFSRICMVDGCRERRAVRGLCHNHHEQRRQATSDGIIPGGRARKLTDEQVVAIRKRSAGFATQSQIGLEFGVTVDTIRDVLKGRGAYAPEAEA